MDERIRSYLAERRFADAFDLLMSEHRVKVFRLAYAMLGNAAQAEDIAQETFVRIWKGLASYRGQSSVATWVYAITRNTCLSYLSGKGQKKVLSLDQDRVRAAAERLYGNTVPTRTIDVMKYFAELPENYQQALRLYYMEQKSYDQIALLLDLPLGTVKTYLHRARKQLAEAVRSNITEGKRV